jgi:Domain of unknown function (DUF1905)
VSQRTEAAAVHFDATLSTIGTSTVVRLPETASANLPSRGQVAVHGTINGVEFRTVLEPDGNSGHWMRVDDTLQHAAGISAGDTATLGIEVTKDWPEPGVPQDLATALAAATSQLADGTAVGSWVLDPAESTAEFRVRHFWGAITVRGTVGPMAGQAAVSPDRHRQADCRSSLLSR